MYRILLFLIIVFINFRCQKDTSDEYKFKFTSIIIGSSYIESQFIKGDSISFLLESYIQSKYDEFEPVDLSTLNFSCDKIIIFNNDTIFSRENIYNKLNQIDKNAFYFERQNYFNGQPDIFYYLIIRNTSNCKFKLTDGFYKFYISAKTINNNFINDSIIIKYNNR